MSSVFFYEPFYDIDRMFENSLIAPKRGNQIQQHGNGAVTNGAVRSIKPRMDLHEDNQKNIVTATFEFPGIAKDGIQIDVHNGRLTVSAETKQSQEHEEHGYAVKERSFGKFSRTLQLPEGVKEEEIKASMDNGVLTVTFPKSTPELAPKRITIS